MVEHVYPTNGDQVLRQSEIGVDRGPGYEGDLVVNGQPIPEEELRRVPEQNQVFYLPGKGTTFEELPGGTNCVTAIAWRSATGRGVDDQTFSWCFRSEEHQSETQSLMTITYAVYCLKKKNTT